MANELDESNVEIFLYSLLFYDILSPINLVSSYADLIASFHTGKDDNLRETEIDALKLCFERLHNSWEDTRKEVNALTNEWEQLKKYVGLVTTIFDGLTPSILLIKDWITDLAHAYEEQDSEDLSRCINGLLNESRSLMERYKVIRDQFWQIKDGKT